MEYRATQSHQQSTGNQEPDLTQTSQFFIERRYKDDVLVRLKQFDLPFFNSEGDTDRDGFRVGQQGRCAALFLIGPNFCQPFFGADRVFGNPMEGKVLVINPQEKKSCCSTPEEWVNQIQRKGQVGLVGTGLNT